MNEGLRYEVRDFVPEQDDPLVYDSWMKAIKLSGAPRIRWPVEMRKIHRGLIAKLLANCPTKVASHPEHPLVIYGWACGGLMDRGDDHPLQVLHMAFVRKPWRERGIGQRLLREVLPDFRTREVYYGLRTTGSCRYEKRWMGIWNPYLIAQELI